MNSTRPYLIRAFYDWIIDNHCTPYIVIEANKPEVVVPEQYIEDDKIVLNVSPFAIRDLLITSQTIEFNAKFGGVPTHVKAPIPAVLAIYAQENGRGMVFAEEEVDDDSDGGEDPPPTTIVQPGSSARKGKPKLTVVK